MMLEIIQNLFGTYTPVLTGAYDEAGNYLGEVVASGMAGVDWPYIAGVLLFALVLLSVFKLVGVMLKNG